MKKNSPSDNTKKHKPQMVNDINEQQYFEQNNFQARRDNMSPHVRRRNDRGGHTKENSPKRYRITGRDSYASEFENWRAEDDPVRQLYQKMDLVRARDDINTVDHSRNINNIQYGRGFPEKIVSWRDGGRQIDKTVIHEDSDPVHGLEVQKVDQSDVKPTHVSEMENPSLLTVGYEKQTPSSRRQQDKQNDVRNRPVKKRHRHKSAEAPVVWMLPDPVPPRND
jgi:hypothetical protein